MDYKVYAIVKHKNNAITFYKTPDDLFTDIHIRFFHTFILDLDYYERHKLTKCEKMSYLTFDNYDIYEFYFAENEELSFSYNKDTGLVPLSSAEFLSETLKYINKSIESSFELDKDNTNTEFKVYSGKNKNYKTFTISKFHFLYDIRFEQIANNPII